MISLIQQIGRIQFGFGAIGVLSAELDMLGVRRPLIMTDQGVLAAGLYRRVVDAMTSAATSVKPAATFDRCPRHPTEDGVLAALCVYRDHDCDGIVAIGGGVVIDVAKGVALMATHAGSLADYTVPAGGIGKIRPGVAPLVAIPTTSGTGSEVGRGAGLQLSSATDGVKSVFMSVNLVPKVAICDPELTLTLPASITAGTGADALSHCLEGYLSSAVNPPVDAVALDGVLRLLEHLPTLVDKPNDRDARWHVMMGAVQGGLSMWKGLGIAHALSIPLDAYDLHHGTLVGMLMPEAVRFARPVARDKLDRLDALLGEAVDVRIESLNERLGLPRRLSLMGVPHDGLAAVAASASTSVFNRSAPRPATTQEFEEILHRVY